MEDDDSDNDLSRNTSVAALGLCLFLIIATFLYIITRAMPKAVRDDVAITKKRLASLSINKREALQVACLVITGFCYVFLLSSLGVAGEKEKTNQNVCLLGIDWNNQRPNY